MTFRAAWPLLGGLALSSCLSSVGPGVSGRVDLAPGEPDVVRLVYMGTGGWIMQHGDQTLLGAPLFTNPGLIETGLAGIHSDTARVNRHMAVYDSLYGVSHASAILVGHAHYDHLMDVPQVARRFAPDADIVANRTAKNLLGTWSGVAGRVRVVNDSAGDAGTPGPWLEVGAHVRVMALRSEHAPHFEGHTLYAGTRDTPASAEPSWAGEWVAGETFAYLVDFMAESRPDSVVFRVYYQDAVAPPPAGFAPDEVVARRRVDVAILVPSTFDQVDWHPEAFVENLRPRWVLLGHWEDFFTPVDEPTHSIRLADLGHFEARLGRVFAGRWWRPDLGTEFRFPVE